MEYAKDAPDKAVAFTILRDVFWKALRLLHPYMPFVTEEVAHQLGFLKDGETILRAPFPTGYTPEERTAWGLTDAVYDFVEAKREMITALRALRAEYKVSPAAFVKVMTSSLSISTGCSGSVIMRMIRSTRTAVFPLPAAPKIAAFPVSEIGRQKISCFWL